MQPCVKLEGFISDAYGREILVLVISQADMQTVKEKNSSF